MSKHSIAVEIVVLYLVLMKYPSQFTALSLVEATQIESTVADDDQCRHCTCRSDTCTCTFYAVNAIAFCKCHILNVAKNLHVCLMFFVTSLYAF